MEHTFTLTNKQTQKLCDVVDVFYTRIIERDVSLPPNFLLLIGGVRRAILDGDGLQQYQIDVLLWLMDILFEQMEDGEYDPQMEQVYHKLAGWWPVSPPWYERVKE